MKLIHYTDKRFILDPHLQYVQAVDFKPQRLWVSVGDDWQRWCEGEAFHPEALVHRYRIHVPSSSRLLRLETAEALDRFTIEHGRALLPDVLAGRPAADHIDWPTVAGEYDGIVIAPYQWSRRFDLFWYYGWDCASGCLWNLKGVTMRRFPRKGRTVSIAPSEVDPTTDRVP